MKIANIVLAGTAALIISSNAAAWAEQTLTGVVKKIDRINGVIAIQAEQSGTVGANTDGAAEQFKAQDRASLNDVHAGDLVTYSTTETGGIKTVTKILKK